MISIHDKLKMSRDGCAGVGYFLESVAQVQSRLIPYLCRRICVGDRKGCQACCEYLTSLNVLKGRKNVGAYQAMRDDVVSGRVCSRWA